MCDDIKCMTFQLDAAHPVWETLARYSDQFFLKPSGLQVPKSDLVQAIVDYASARYEAGLREGQRLADDERLALVQGYAVLASIAQDNADPREDMAPGMSAFEAAVHIGAVIERADEAAGVKVTDDAKNFTQRLLASVKRAATTPEATDADHP